MNVSSDTRSQATAPAILELMQCLSCGQALMGQSTCPACQRPYPVRDGIVEAIGPLAGRNQIVAAFYDGPGWIKFGPWEQAFLLLQGGVRRARTEILRHAIKPDGQQALGLEVGIGSGENLPYLPADWAVYGVDIARTQLELCQRRHPRAGGRLAWAEGENLPFPDATFDACWSVGGFNYFRDHEAALCEMRRVTRPGRPVVIADEIPSLHRAGLGNLLGIPALDAWWMKKLGLDADFAKMVLTFDIDLEALAGRVWPDAIRHRIWHKLGYCLVNDSLS